MSALVAALIVLGSPWADVGEWSQERVEALLTDSPWVAKVSVYPEQVGRDTRLLPPDHQFYDPMTADVLAWVPGRDAFPGLSESAPARKSPKTPAADYYVRWYSARVVREAIVRAAELGDGMGDAQASSLRRDDDLTYVIALSGKSLERLAKLPWTAFEANVELTTSEGVRYPLLEAQVTGPEVVLVFDRTDERPITEATQWVKLLAQFGDATFQAEFKPPEMKHGETFDLDGAPKTDVKTNPKRAIELAILRGADRGLKRAVRTIEIRKNTEGTDDLILLYDPRFETGELATLDFDTRTRALATRVGTSNVPLRRLWVINAATEERRWLRGEDCTKLTELTAGTAKVYFEGVVQKPK